MLTAWLIAQPGTLLAVSNFILCEFWWSFSVSSVWRS
jgi:hypothetical protein